MSMPYDTATKLIAQVGPQDLLNLVGIDGRFLRVINTEFDATSLTADMVHLVQASDGQVAVIYVAYSSADSTTDQRLLAEIALARYRLNKRVRLVVLLLSPAALPYLSGEIRELTPHGVLHFKYERVEVYKLSVEQILAAGQMVAPLAILTEEAMADPFATLQRVRPVIASQPPELRKELWGCLGLLAGLSLERDIIKQLIERTPEMRESTTVQLFIEEGRKEGRKAGRKEGLRLGEARGHLRGELQPTLRARSQCWVG